MRSPLGLVAAMVEGGHGWHNWHWHGHKGHHVEHHGKKHGGGKHKGGHHVSHHKAAGHHVSHHRGGGDHVSHRGGHRGGGGRGGGRRSDIRLKEGIVPLARLNNGLELYRFRYKGKDHAAYVGVMAQQVQKIEPSAVWRDHDGYLAVNYDRIGLKFMTWREWLERTRSN
jgi:Chaperone of endosialidase